jgi:hypothetical protein
VYFDVRNAFKIKWFLSKKVKANPLLLRNDVHAVVGLKNFLSLLFKTERSFGTFLNHRPYENMFLNNFLISIFRVRLLFNQDESCPEIGKMI